MSILVEGNFNHEIESDSSEEEESDNEEELERFHNKDFNDTEDDEEDEVLEVFNGTNEVKYKTFNTNKKSKSKATSSTNNSIINEPPKKTGNSLLDAMSAAVEKVEQEIENINLNESTNKNVSKPKSTSTTTSTTQVKDDIFGIGYQPFQKKTNTTNKNINQIEDEHSFDLETTLKQMSSSTNHIIENDDEFDFDDINTTLNKDSIQVALDRAAINATIIEEHQTDIGSTEQHEIPSETIIKEEETSISILEAAKQSLNEFKAIYSTGLGDIEVRLLDSSIDLDTSPIKHEYNKRLSTTNKIIDVIEEGDEDEENEDESHEEAAYLATISKQTELINEWDILDSNLIDLKSNENEILKETTIINNMNYN